MNAEQQTLFFKTTMHEWLDARFAEVQEQMQLKNDLFEREMHEKFDATQAKIDKLKQVAAQSKQRRSEQGIDRDFLQTSSTS